MEMIKLETKVDKLIFVLYVILHLGFWPRIFIGIIDKVSFSFGMYVG
jgi:hypothetical protein